MKRVLLLLPVVLCMVQVSWAQYSTRGFMLRPHFLGTSWKIENTDMDNESGGGFGLGADYGFNDLVAAYVEFAGASIDDGSGGTYALGHFDLGARFTFGRTYAPLKFTANAALTGRSAQVNILGTDFEVNGAGFTVGGGLEYFLSRALGIDFNIQMTFGKINEVKAGGITVEVDENANSARANLGVVWRLGRR